MICMVYYFVKSLSVMTYYDIISTERFFFFFPVFSARGEAFSGGSDDATAFFSARSL